ncbi:MAG: glucosaminidase domain-containing protein [Cumulibacter sp.]
MMRRRQRTLAIVGAVLVLAMFWFFSGGDDKPDTHIGSPPTVPQQFLEYAAVPAQEGMQEHGVPASVSLAQAIVESDWGRSELTQTGRNYFGIKCAGNSPYASGCVGRPTQECDAAGLCSEVVGQFRTYDSAEDSFRDHGHFLTVNPRYAEAFQYVDNPDQFAIEVAKAGYATDPTYADKLIELMKQYDLYQYDAL